MKNNLIKTVIGASLIAGVLTGCNTTEEVSYKHHAKVYLPDDYHQQLKYDITPEQLVKLSTPFYSELSDTSKLSEEVLDMKKSAKEFERKEAERIHKEELEKQRLAKLEQLKKEQDNKQNVISRGEVEVNSNYSGWITVNVSYYGTDCYGCGNLTSTGINVSSSKTYKGLSIIATDPRVIPTWSIVELETPNGLIKAVAADKGGYIKGNKIDVLVSSESYAATLGRHNGKLRIVGKMTQGE